MPSAREDYLIRLIREMSAVLRRLRARLLEGAGGSDPAAAAAGVREDAGAAIAQLLGPQASLLEHLDPSSAAALVADPQRVAVWVALLRVQAAGDETLGEGSRAAARTGRAAALEAAARAHWGASYPDPL